MAPDIIDSVFVNTKLRLLPTILSKSTCNSNFQSLASLDPTKITLFAVQNWNNQSLRHKSDVKIKSFEHMKQYNQYLSAEKGEIMQ